MSMMLMSTCGGSSQTYSATVSCSGSSPRRSGSACSSLCGRHHEVVDSAVSVDRIGSKTSDVVVVVVVGYFETVCRK